MKKRLLVIFLPIFLVLVLLCSTFAFYVSDYYHAATTAVSAIASDKQITSTDDMLVLRPDFPSQTALIFYPGAKVEYTAYVPLLEKLRAQGITCILMKMPYNLAVFHVDAADKVYAHFPDIKQWFIGGHSLGGAMASSYMAKHKDKISGLILLGAYIYGNVDPNDALTVYGSNDGVLNRSKITYATNVHVIQGGNHAQFGDYGTQKGDGTPTISADEQQKEAADDILEFIINKSV